MRRLLILFSLLLAACGGQTTDNEPPPPPRGPCPASHDLVNGRCVVREIYFPGGTFVMGRGFCPHANLLDQPPGWECPLADRPHTVTVKPFYVDAAPAVHSDDKQRENTCAPDADCEPLLASADQFVRNPLIDNGQSAMDRYCAKFGKRVLTEAEWEYIATGGGKRLYPWGDQPPSCARANIGSGCKLRWPLDRRDGLWRGGGRAGARRRGARGRGARCFGQGGSGRCWRG